jgi:hypothetical protein
MIIAVGILCTGNEGKITVKCGRVVMDRVIIR